MPITATYLPAQFRLSVVGTTAAEPIVITRTAPGALEVNGGAVPVTGGPATVANTSLIEIVGDAGADTITLDEVGGLLPAAEIFGGAGNDTVTGGSGGDTLSGEADDDSLFGRGGIDLLFGGFGNDSLSGGDGDDQMFGGDGNDALFWNPGDDSDLMEGEGGTDTAVVNGGGGAEVFTITANGTRVRFDRIDPAPFVLDIGTTEILALNAGGGNDTISTSGNLAALISLTLDGGTGNDTILAGNGADMIQGGDGDDFVDGQQGNDTAFLGANNDTFQWDPGDGSDVVEGGTGTDSLLFNGSAANEIYDLSPNGGRVNLFRNIGAIVMDIDDVETFTIRALGGVDNININNLSGTDASQVAVDLAGSIGGVTGDAAADIVTVAGTGFNDTVSITGSGTSYSVLGLAASVNVTNSEGANDSLVLNGFGGNDNFNAAVLAAGIVKLTFDGGAGDDTLLGSQGADIFLGGDGTDFVFGDNGNDLALLGAGNDVFQWEPGDGNDVIEGQGNTDELRFVGSNASENINIAANGGRVLFFRDVAAVTMDLDDVESILFTAIGGTDTVTVGDLSGTDVTSVTLRFSASGGGGDLAVDTAIVNNTNAADTILVTSAPSGVFVSGLPWTVALQGAEPANDRLDILGLGGDDVINATALAAGLLSLTVNGGLGADLFLGSAGGDLFIGGDGNDTSLLGAGNDVAVWNPGDDNDIIEGQAGIDTLRFNGANVAETITISPNGGRAIFFRDVAAVVMDLNDTEVIEFNALGGADFITVDSLAGTDITNLAIGLASTIGGAAGDGAADTLTFNATTGANTIDVSGASGALITVTGLPATATISQFETSNVDQLRIIGLAGNDTISATGLVPHFSTLLIDGGDGNDTIRSNGDGTYLGGIGDDMMFAGLTNSLEAIDGGSGTDTLDTTTWGGLYTIDMVTGATNYSGESFLNFENLTTGDGDDTITGTSAANVIITNGGVDTINSGAGNDTLNGGAGADAMIGSTGNDTYFVDNVGDTVTELALEGTDSVSSSITYLLGTNLENLTLTGLDAINGTGNASSNFITGNVANNTLDGGSGSDVLSGGGGTDTLLAGTGTDLLFGEAGNDVLYFGANLTASDSANGGADRDSLVLQGNYTYTFSAGNFAEVESISVQTGAQTRWGDLANNRYDYNLTTVDANVAAGVQLIVNGQSLLAGEDLTFNGAAETDGRFQIYGGLGTDTLTGGGQSDVFFFEGTRWGAGDTVHGGASNDALVFASGSGLNTFVFTDTSFTSIESISVNNRFATDPSQTPSYSLTLANGNVAAGATLIINGSTLAAGQTLTVNGSAESNGHLTLFGGAGADNLTGGALADLLYGGAGADFLTGGGGNDTFRYDAAGHSPISTPDLITDFTLGDLIDLSRIDANTFAGGDQAFSFIGTAAFSGTGAASAGQLRFQNQSGATWIILGDTDGNGIADFQIFVAVTDASPIAATDFVL